MSTCLWTHKEATAVQPMSCFCLVGWSSPRPALKGWALHVQLLILGMTGSPYLHSVWGGHPWGGRKLND